MKKTLVLFDFDGTLSKKDTYIQFIFYACGTRRAITGFGLLLPQIFLYYCKLISPEALKIKMTDYFFRGISSEVLKAKAKDFMEHLHTSGNFREDTMTQLREFKARGDEVCVVSASLDIWIEPFAKWYDINYLCTEIKWVEGKYAGFKTPNCNGEEKARRIKQRYNLGDFAQVIAYGNSRGDRYMFDLANKTLYIR